ncbi:MAG TPA: hypothetical protein VLH84_03290 [Patescibacteria group bacterium]|nr:hypothetical protein [Patescibacteria group bacterium]
MANRMYDAARRMAWLPNILRDHPVRSAIGAAVLGATVALASTHPHIGRAPAEGAQVCVKVSPGDGFQSVIDSAVRKEVGAKQDPDLNRYGLDNPTDAQGMVDRVTQGGLQPGNAYNIVFSGTVVSKVTVGNPFDPTCQG